MIGDFIAQRWHERGFIAAIAQQAAQAARAVAANPGQAVGVVGQEVMRRMPPPPERPVAVRRFDPDHEQADSEGYVTIQTTTAQLLADIEEAQLDILDELQNLNKGSPRKKRRGHRRG